MVLRRKGSFAAGAAAAVMCTAAWGLRSAGPATVTHHAAVPAAWLWSPRDMAWTVVPYARPLREPQLRRTKDGAILVAEGFDREREVQRFEASGRFVPLAVSEEEEARSVPPFSAKLNPVAGGGWIAQAGTDKTRTTPTWVLHDPLWDPGPALPAGYWIGLTAAREGGGWAGYCENPYGTGPLGICSAREGGALFRWVPVPEIGPMPASGGFRENWLVAPARGGEVLVVSRDDESVVHMLLVDVETGIVREGPAAPRAFPATRFARGPAAPICPGGCGGATWATTGDGRVMIAPVLDATEDVLQPKGAAFRALALLLSVGSLGALVALRRRLDAPWVIAGLVGVPFALGVLAFAAAVLVATSLHG